MTSSGSVQSAAKIGFGALIAAASSDAAYKYLGFGGIAAYTVFCIAAVFFFSSSFFLGRFCRFATERRSLLLAGVTLAALIPICLVIYPLADSGRLGDRGSDADDALIIGAQALVSGHYPFYERTYYGNPIAPMPGSILLAIPFAAKPLIVLQNIFWLAVLVWIVGRQIVSRRYALLLLWLLLVLCPIVPQNLFTATDRLSNTIYILVGMWMLAKNLQDEDAAWWEKVLPAILLGVGLSSRSNFLFLMPVFFSFLGQRAGWTPAMKYMLLAGAAFIAVTLPFWLYDPSGFMPFLVQEAKMSQFNSTLPHASLVIAVVGGIFSIALSLLRMPADGFRFFLSCGVMQMFLILMLSTVSSLNMGRLDLYMGHVSYGVFSLVFVMVSAVIALQRQDGSSADRLRPT